MINYIFEYLKSNGNATIPGFGTFYLQNTQAKIDTELKSILPPAKEIAFSIDNESQNEGLVSFISKKENITISQAKQELEQLTNHWKSTLDLYKNLNIDNIGSFHIQENQLTFTGQRIDIETPDFYGLEEIDVQKLKQGKKLSSKSYAVSKTILWIFILILIGLGIILYFYPQYFFGKDSIINLPEIDLTRYLNNLK